MAAPRIVARQHKRLSSRLARLQIPPRFITRPQRAHPPQAPPVLAPRPATGSCVGVALNLEKFRPLFWLLFPAQPDWRVCAAQATASPPRSSACVELATHGRPC